MDEAEEQTQAEAQEFLARLGKRIRSLRRARKLSQEQLAEAADLMQHYVSQVELGQRNVSVVTLRVVAKALDLSLAELVAGLD
jgi:transcriptional regulator with XRE-family HTH domain